MIKSITLAAMLATGLALAACGSSTATSAVTPVVTTAETDITNAVAFYGVAKGIAQAAAIANPANAATINAAISKIDPYVAALQAGTPTLAGIVVSAAGLVDQAVALENSTAAAVKVVPAAAT